METLVISNYWVLKRFLWEEGGGKLVCQCIEEEAIVLVGLLLLHLHLPMLLSQFQPIFVLFVAISSVLYSSRKAMYV